MTLLQIFIIVYFVGFLWILPSFIFLDDRGMRIGPVIWLIGAIGIFATALYRYDMRSQEACEQKKVIIRIERK